MTPGHVETVLAVAFIAQGTLIRAVGIRDLVRTGLPAIIFHEGHVEVPAPCVRGRRSVGPMAGDTGDLAVGRRPGDLMDAVAGILVGDLLQIGRRSTAAQVVFGPVVQVVDRRRPTTQNPT